MPAQRDARKELFKESGKWTGGETDPVDILALAFRVPAVRLVIAFVLLRPFALL